MHTTDSTSFINFFSQKNFEKQDSINNSNSPSIILESIASFSIHQYSLNSFEGLSFKLIEGIAVESFEFSIYGIIDEDQLILKDVEEATDLEELEQAKEQGFIGFRGKSEETDVIKLDKELPSNIKLVTYQNKENIQTIEPATIGVLTPEEKTRVISKIKAQIIYLQTLHATEEKKEELIKHLTKLLSLLESKKEEDQDLKARYKFSTEIGLEMKGEMIKSLLNSFLSIVEKIIEARKEEEKQNAIELKKRTIKLIIIKSEIDKDELKNSDLKTSQIKIVMMTINLHKNYKSKE